MKRQTLRRSVTCGVLASAGMFVLPAFADDLSNTNSSATTTHESSDTTTAPRSDTSTMDKKSDVGTPPDAYGVDQQGIGGSGDVNSPSQSGPINDKDTVKDKDAYKGSDAIGGSGTGDTAKDKNDTTSSSTTTTSKTVKKSSKKASKSTDENKGMNDSSTNDSNSDMK